MKITNKTKGATVVEYAVLAGGLSIAAISAMYMLGKENSEVFNAAAGKVEESRESMTSGGNTSQPGPSPSPDPDTEGAMLLTYNASNSEVTLPLHGSVNASIDWGGPSTTCPTTVSSAGDITCTYDAPGTYTVAITGTVTQFGNTQWAPVENAANLISIDDWGSTGLTSLYQAFKGASNLASLPGDLPATVNNLFATFRNSGYNGTDISTWDTSNVTNMSYTFADTNFNQDISSWNTSNVGSMEGMFTGASLFDQPIGSWSTSSLHSTGYMFRDAVNFNRDLSGWSMGGVTWAPEMFAGATNFNGNISTWDMSQARDIGEIFKNASSFNGNISAWNTLNLENLSGAFRGATSFDQNIGGWNTSNVYSMNYAFKDAISFDQDLSSWSTGRVDTMDNMFEGASVFDQDLSGWCVTRISTKPANFDTGATAWASQRPVWGTCP